MNTMDNIEKLREDLKTALHITLTNLSQQKGETGKENIISGWNDSYQYGGINIFETSFVDALVSSLSKIQDIGMIGWEVNYPWNEEENLWYQRKLDLAIGYIHRDGEPNSKKLQSLFEMPIEVKKLPLYQINTEPKNRDFSFESELYIWQDIFKLYGYHLKSSNDEEKLKTKVGKEKIMLTFSEMPNNKEIFDAFKKNIENRFLNLERLKVKESYKGQWLSDKAFAKLEKEYSEGKERDFNLEYILEKFLYWSNSDHRDFLIEKCEQAFEPNKIVKGCTFIHEAVNESKEPKKNILVATILHL
jgi:hypothetical protein